MSNIIKLKTGASVPTQNDLVENEVGISTSTYRLYQGRNGSNPVQIGTEIFSGEGTPSDDLGKNGDLYIQLDEGTAPIQTATVDVNTTSTNQSIGSVYGFNPTTNSWQVILPELSGRPATGTLTVELNSYIIVDGSGSISSLTPSNLTLAFQNSALRFYKVDATTASITIVAGEK